MPTKQSKRKEQLEAAEEAVRQALGYVNELYDKYGPDEERELQDQALEAVGKRHIELRALENADSED